MLQDSTNSWKAFSASCWLWKCFPCKKLSRCLKWWLARGQMNMVNEAKLGSQIDSTFEALVAWHVARHCRGELGPFCWPALAAGVAIFSASHHGLSILLRCNGFARIQKAVVDQTSSRPPVSDHDVFLVQVWLWGVLWSFFSIQPLSWSSPVVI